MTMPVFTMEAANLICGDTGPASQPGQSTLLVLQEMKLPGWEENYADYSAGGAQVNYEVNTNFNRLEATFTLHGWQPPIMGLLAQADFQEQVFTAYGMIREKRSGDALKAMAVMRGRLGRVNPTAFRRGDLMGHEYSIRGIWHYELWMAPSKNSELAPIYQWDFFESWFWVWGPNGPRDLNQDLRRCLSP